MFRELFHGRVVVGFAHEEGGGGVVLDGDGFPLAGEEGYIVGVDDVVLEVEPF